MNFDIPKYGTLAEIGAGQEVARKFFHAGGASGTIAKSISAYDMVFGDAIYGKTARYVSRERLKFMLDHEYELLIERLSPIRGDRTTFFVFADTVAASNHQGTNEAHGCIECIVGFGSTILNIFSRDALQKIKDENPVWERMVPIPVAEAIKRRKLFGYEGNPAR
jgi:hypothetical protein